MGQKTSTPSNLKPGDHIFTNRAWILYYHHGIYVGDDMVIHLMAAGIKKKSGSCDSCPKCGYDGRSGIVKTCLDCFLNGKNLHIFVYNIPCNSPDEVIRIATEFLQGEKDFVLLVGM
ncbi:protein LEAD-SENSITIVE 1-like isoform X2 [Mangifera indica]|uniref:protein LEAD-SENSITIVE 1-like isoform X2 n=1 Tax=Mangifera indica TaxID=29780 RepID=UPI001CFAE65A|nr:protein LEAD-SENSITIVE 1-like isoform X2 [Mangifera indica]